MISQGADIHFKNELALTSATFYGHLKIVRYLISECFANINENNSFYLARAFNNRYLEVMAYLVSQGVDASYLIRFHRQYAVIWARGQERARIRAQKRIYFWWIRECHQMSAPSGIRMCLASLVRYESICAL